MPNPRCFHTLQDIVETPAAFELHCDAPGFTPKDINVEMNEGVITVSGKRKEEKQEEKEGKVVRRERTMATFTRSFTLPDNVKDDEVSASLVNGVLKVTVPKTEPAAKPAPKKIQVSGGEQA
ncbi:HSP20-like chaperone [Scenedesmus sp. NREL 46B-D3]|nr:HSP20-like chaperone [Scenedesmus sp. NREL 46B-D3]